MTTISFRFSFSIMVHKKSHFLTFLSIMNCTVLCPIEPYSQRPLPPQRNNADVRVTDRKLHLIKQWEIHFKGRKQCLMTRWLSSWRLKAQGDAHKAGCARAALVTHEITQTCIQTLMSQSGRSLWKYITSCCSITKELGNTWLYKLLTGRPDCRR